MAILISARKQRLCCTQRRLQKMGKHCRQLHRYFPLAQSELLDNKIATTHWGYADKFKTMYPTVNLQPRKWLLKMIRCFCRRRHGVDGIYLVDRTLLWSSDCSDTAKSHVLDVSEQAKLFMPAVVSDVHSTRTLKRYSLFWKGITNKCTLSD